MAPTVATGCPRTTRSPALTFGFDACVWRVIRPLPWSVSTIVPYRGCASAAATLPLVAFQWRRSTLIVRARALAPMMFNRVRFRHSGPPLTPKPAHRSLARVLQSEAQFAEWTTRYRQEAALTLLLRKHLPRPIAERIRVTDTRAGVLELAASAGAIAATLRQRAPELRAALARDGCDFTEIRVRVQVAGIAGPTQKPLPRQWDSASAAPIFDLADRLPDGPLKAALTRWSRRARGR